MAKVPAKKPPVPKLKDPEAAKEQALRTLFAIFTREWFEDNADEVGAPPSAKDVADIVSDFTDQYSTGIFSIVEAACDSFLAVAVTSDEDEDDDADEDEDDDDDEDEDDDDDDE